MNAIGRNVYALPRPELGIVHRDECDNDTRVSLAVLLKQSRDRLGDIAIFTERLLGELHECIAGLSDDLIGRFEHPLDNYFNVWPSNYGFFTCGRKTWRGGSFVRRSMASGGLKSRKASNSVRARAISGLWLGSVKLEGSRRWGSPLTFLFYTWDG